MLRCDEVGHLLKLVGENYVCDRCHGWMPRTGGHWHEKAAETKSVPKTPLGKSAKKSPSGGSSYTRPTRYHKGGKLEGSPSPSLSISPSGEDDDPKERARKRLAAEPVKDSSDWPPYLRAYEKYTDDQLKEAILELLDHKLYRSDKYTSMAEDIAGKSFTLSIKQRIALANHLKFHEKDF